MSSTLVMTEAVIDDTDLYLNRFMGFNSSEEILSDQSVSDNKYSDDEIVVTIDENSEEMELMKSFGLPIGFTSRSVSKRSNKRKKNKNKQKSKTSESNDSEDINHLFEEYWEQSGQQLVDKSLNDFYISSQIKVDSEEGNQTSDVSTESSEDLLTEMWQKHWSEVYNRAYIQFVEEFHRNTVDKQNRIENKFEILPKMLTNCKLNEECVDGNEGNSSDGHKSNEDNKSDPKNSGDINELSANISGFSSTSLNGRNNDSDSDGPPEERPTRVKRDHESDSVDLSEENRDQNETEFNSQKKLIQKNRKKKRSKYWYQRFRLFSRFDAGIELDDESWYSVTPERIAQHIANRFSQRNYFLIIDAFCGAGGNTIQFAMISPFIKVIAIDIDPKKIALAKHNAKIYEVDHRIEFIVTDYMLFAKSCSSKPDAVFLSPPWGGPKYLKQKNYTLDMMTPNGADVFRVTNTYVSPNIGFLLPRNIDTNELSQLAGEGGQGGEGNNVEVEQNLLNKKIKTVTAYFGDLIRYNSE